MMKARAFLLIAFATLALTSCGKPQPTDDPNWLLGYHAGFDAGESDKGAYGQGMQDGRDEGRDEVCKEILQYSKKMAKDLDDNTQICGWPDKDVAGDPTDRP